MRLVFIQDSVDLADSGVVAHPWGSFRTEHFTFLTGLLTQYPFLCLTDTGDVYVFEIQASLDDILKLENESREFYKEPLLHIGSTSCQNLT